MPLSLPSHWPVEVICLSQCQWGKGKQSSPKKVHACSIVSDSFWPWTVAHQVPLSMKFSRPEYWSGLPFPSPGDLPDPGLELASLMSPALAGIFFSTNPWQQIIANHIMVYHSPSFARKTRLTSWRPELRLFFLLQCLTESGYSRVFKNERMVPVFKDGK